MIEVSGYIDEMLIDMFNTDKVYDKEQLIYSMLDAPIMRDGEVIGAVIDVDLHEGIWYGTIWDDVSLNIDASVDNTVNSINIINYRIKKVG